MAKFVKKNVHINNIFLHNDQTRNTYAFVVWLECYLKNVSTKNKVAREQESTEAYRCLILLSYKYNVAIKFIAL